MSGGGDERDPMLGQPNPSADRLGREIRQDLTVVKVRAQLLRRLLRRGVLHATDLDYGLAEIERAVARLHTRLRRFEDDHPPPG